MISREIEFNSVARIHLILEVKLRDILYVTFLNET